MRLVSALLALALALGAIPAGAGSASAADALPTRIALAIPLTVPPESTGLITAEDLETYTSPTGILTRKLDAVEGQEVAIGIDPMIIASIRILGNTAPASATDWLERLRDADNEIFALSYADSDIAALSQAGSGTVLTPTSFPIDPTRYPAEPEEGGETSTPSPGETAPPAEPDVPTLETITDWPYTMENVLWPRRNTVTAADLASFNATTPVTTILSSGNVTATPGASAAVGENAVLVSDEIVSGLLIEAVEALTPVDWQAAVDRLAAELARKPGNTTILATFDRTTTEAVGRLAETVTAVRQLADVVPTGLLAASTEPPTAVRVADIPVDPDRLSRIRLLLAAEARIVPFSSVMADPTPLTGERRLSLLALSSNSWVDPTTVWTTTVDEWLAQSNAILTSVQIAESSALNFFQDKGNLPIAVSNQLEYPVTVYVTVRSATGILVVMNSRVPVEIEAGSQARASIPVQSIANGQASLEVSLSSVSNVPLGTPKTITANVAAGWETT
ncbi:MAG TPA: DUF6049 family protein, partial [Homoserinimonas sp.]|nr:DUF6049 family protein [Homoserinimonas sp.]